MDGLRGYIRAMKVWQIILGAVLMGLAGCGAVLAPPKGGPPSDLPLTPKLAAQNFVAVVDAVEPVAEAVCLGAGLQGNCDFQIAIDGRAGQPPNAFQTVDEAGRPIIAFTLSLIATARSRDELAFIMGHEAGHHIAGHLARQQDSAMRGAVLAGVMAQASGLDSAAVDRAAQMGAGIGARRYSKDFELEADLIGTRIALAAGFDPVLGAAFFDRLPDPGNRFLGTHPANDSRKALVLGETARLRGQ